MGQDLLTPFQRDVLRVVPTIGGITEHFYLTDGTALAVFYLHHRESEDFDFFSVSEVETSSANDLSAVLARALGARVVEVANRFNRNIYHLERADKRVKIEFNHFPHDQIEAPLKFRKLKIDSLYDIAVNKTFTIFQRPRARDYVDLFLALQKLQVPLDHLARDARIKFDMHMDLLQAGAKLAKVTEMKDYPRMRIEFAFKNMRKFFLAEAKKLGRRILK